MTVPKPKWFSENTVMVCTAPTCGLSKGGRPLPIVDKTTGKRVQTVDPETGENVDAVDDQLLLDAAALADGRPTKSLLFIPRDKVSLRCAVPIYYDSRYDAEFEAAMRLPEFKGFSSATIGQLVERQIITVRGGHGSPSQDQRVGDIPYIKVSDLRAGLVNINPTNRIPRSVARKFWDGDSSGLRAYDLVCPERTSKNIGDFCVLMPGQEQVVMTNEVLIFRPGPKAQFDAFFLLWALTLKIVRNQWRRVIFMQTNREDVGKRYLEIRLPITDDPELSANVSKAFREYYVDLATARKKLITYLHKDHNHHFFVAGGADTDVEDEVVSSISSK